MAGKARKAGRVAKRIGKGLLSRAKPRAMNATIGAGVRVVEGAVGDKVDFIKDNWYGGPVAMLAASLVLPEKFGVPLATIAGYKGAFNYEIDQFQQGKRETSPVPQFKREEKNTGLLNSPSPSMNTAGADETADAGLLFAPN